MLTPIYCIGLLKVLPLAANCCSGSTLVYTSYFMYFCIFCYFLNLFYLVPTQVIWVCSVYSVYSTCCIYRDYCVLRLRKNRGYIEHLL